MLDTKRRTRVTGDPFGDLLEIFETARFPERGKPLQNNTRLYRYGEDTLAVRLHNTDVVTLDRMDDQNVAVTLDTGGWRTVTTKSRMNEWAPGRVMITQHNYVWYVRFGFWGENGRTFEYKDRKFLYLVKRTRS